MSLPFFRRRERRTPFCSILQWASHRVSPRTHVAMEHDSQWSGSRFQILQIPLQVLIRNSSPWSTSTISGTPWWVSHTSKKTCMTCSGILVCTKQATWYIVDSHIQLTMPHACWTQHLSKYFWSTHIIMVVDVCLLCIQGTPIFCVHHWCCESTIQSEHPQELTRSAVFSSTMRFPSSSSQVGWSRCRDTLSFATRYCHLAPVMFLVLTEQEAILWNSALGHFSTTGFRSSFKHHA